MYSTRTAERGLYDLAPLATHTHTAHTAEPSLAEHVPRAVRRRMSRVSALSRPDSRPSDLSRRRTGVLGADRCANVTPTVRYSTRYYGPYLVRNSDRSDSAISHASHVRLRGSRWESTGFTPYMQYAPAFSRAARRATVPCQCHPKSPLRVIDSPVSPVPWPVPTPATDCARAPSLPLAAPPPT
jgi:hypothetical protein